MTKSRILRPQVTNSRSMTVLDEETDRTLWYQSIKKLSHTKGPVTNTLH